MSKGNQEQGNEGMELDLKRSVDLEIVGDNIEDIALFTIEKYEFSNDATIPAAAREEAIQQIKDALWKRVEELRKHRKQILASMFATAAQAMEDAMNKKE